MVEHGMNLYQTLPKSSYSKLTLLRTLALGHGRRTYIIVCVQGKLSLFTDQNTYGPNKCKQV